MTFDPIRTPVNYALLAGRRTPGVCDVLGVSSPFRWDIRSGVAQSGAVLVFRGNPPAKPTLRLRLYTEQDFADWADFSPLVLREPPPDAAQVAQQSRQIEAARTQRDALAQAIAIDPINVGGNEIVQQQLRTASRRADQRLPGLVRRPQALDIWHPITEQFGIRSVVVEEVLQPVQTGDGEWTVDIKFIEYREPVFALARPEGAQAQPQDRFERAIAAQNAANQALRDRLGT